MTRPLTLDPPPASSPDGATVPRPTLLVGHAVTWIAQRPWLGVAALGVVGATVMARALLRAWRQRRHARGARLIVIAPPPEVEPAGAGALWANLAGTLTPSRIQRLIHGTPHLAWEYAWAGRALTISLWAAGTIPAGTVEAAIRGAWPGATIATLPQAPPIPPGAAAATGGQIRPVYPDWLPLATDHDQDPLRAVIAAGTHLHDGEYACLQILARPATPRRARRARQAAHRLRDGQSGLRLDVTAPVRWMLELLVPTTRTRTSAAGYAPYARRDPAAERDVRAILDKTGHPLWETAIRYTAASSRAGNPKPRLRAIAAGLAAAYAIYTGRNRLAHRTRLHKPVQVMSARRFSGGFLTSGPELALLAGLPHDVAVAGLDRAGARPVAPPVPVPAGGRSAKVLGQAVSGHAVALALPDARYHLHMVGATGSGKTTLMSQMILQDINAGRGTVVIDPHGDLVLDILDRLPAGVANRLVLFDPDQPHPPVLNPLDGDDHQLLVDNIVAIMSNIFVKAWGPRMDDVMRVACLTLLRHANVTLQHIPPLLNSAQFRSAMTADLDDPEGLSGFWQWYDQMTPALRAQVIGPVLARLRSFLLRDFVRHTMGYPHSSFDMRQVLDGGVLLARLPKGILGEETSRLMGSLILAKVWQAATARAAVPAEKRRDAAIYLDEAQNFLTLAASLDTMLAEARKYRLSMVLAHQDLAQFPRELLAAVSANARNKVYFACSPEDAHTLARHTLPELDEHDLSHLDAYHAAARLVVDGRQTHAFTLRTRPPRPAVGQAAAIRRISSAREPHQDTSAIDDLARRLSAPRRIRSASERP